MHHPTKGDGSGNDSIKTGTTVQKSPVLGNILKKDAFWISLLGLLTLLIFCQFIFSNSMLYGSDTMGNLDSRVFFKNAMVHDHQFPLWFPTRLGGMPTIDASFGDAMYPPSVLFYLLLPVHKALSARLVFHVFVAGLFFFLMLRRGFGMSRAVSFIGAVFYMLNPQFFSHIYPGHDGKMFVIAWLPFVIWRMKTLMEIPNLLNATLLSLGVSMLIFTPHIQMTYFVMWGLFLYWCVALVQKWLSTRKIGALLPMAVFFWVGIVIGLAGGSLQFFPSYMYIHDAYSVRGVDRGFEYAASWSLHWPEFFSLWVPEFVGDSVGKMNSYWSENAFKLNTEYAGMMAVLLGVLAVVSRTNVWRLFWVGIGVLAVGYAMGAHSPVFHVAYNLVPGVKKFRAAAMMMFWFSFAACLLSSLFLADVSKGRFTGLGDAVKKKWLKGLLIAMGSITVLTLLFSLKGFVRPLMEGLVPSMAEQGKGQTFDANFSRNFVPFLWAWWIFAIAALGALYGHISGKIDKRVVFVLVLAVGLIDLLRIDVRFMQNVNPRQYFSSPANLKTLAAGMESDPFRCYSLPGTLPQNGEGVHGLEGVGGFHDNELRWYREFRGDQQDRNYIMSLLTFQEGRPYLLPEKLSLGSVYLDLANVRYYLIRQGSDIVIAENKNALGRVSFARNYAVMDTSQVLKALASNGYDIRTTVSLTKEPDFKPAAADTSSALPAATYRWTRYSTNIRSVEVDAPADGYLRISEAYYPGWEIRLDGKPVKTYQSDLSWMAIGMPKGKHRVEIRAGSIFLKTSLAITIPLVCFLIVFWTISGIAVYRKRGKDVVKQE